MVVLAVSIDADDAAYHKFLKDYSVSMVTVRDEAKKSSSLYGTFGWPETYVIDQEWRDPPQVHRRRGLGKPGDYGLLDQVVRKPPAVSHQPSGKSYLRYAPKAQSLEPKALEPDSPKAQ